MKKMIAFAMTVFLLTGVSIVFAQDVVDKHPACPLCGMDRAKFAHSRVYIAYEDGTTAGTCSIHCAAIDLAVNVGKTPREILVGDFNTRALIDAEKAAWVIGGSKMGVMTHRAKWAFAEDAAAQKFIDEYGGEKATFDDVMKATFEDMYKDISMIREKKKKMKMKHQG
jgi:nitrous oxide reductase accessory protein NosL